MENYYNNYDNYKDRLEDYDERSIHALEEAVGGCLGLILGFGVALIVCGVIYILTL